MQVEGLGLGDVGDAAQSLRVATWYSAMTESSAQPTKNEVRSALKCMPRGRAQVSKVSITSCSG